MKQHRRVIYIGPTSIMDGAFLNFGMTGDVVSTEAVLDIYVNRYGGWMPANGCPFYPDGNVVGIIIPTNQLFFPDEV